MTKQSNRVLIPTSSTKQWNHLPILPIRPSSRIISRRLSRKQSRKRSMRVWRSTSHRNHSTRLNQSPWPQLRRKRTKRVRRFRMRSPNKLGNMDSTKKPSEKLRQKRGKISFIRSRKSLRKKLRATPRPRRKPKILDLNWNSIIASSPRHCRKPRGTDKRIRRAVRALNRSQMSIRLKMRWKSIIRKEEVITAIVTITSTSRTMRTQAFRKSNSGATTTTMMILRTLN